MWLSRLPGPQGWDIQEVLAGLCPERGLCLQAGVGFGLWVPMAPPAPHQVGTTTLRHGRCRTCCWLGSSQSCGEDMSHSLCLQGMGRGRAEAAVPSPICLLAGPCSPSAVPHTVRGRARAQRGCCRPPGLGMGSGAGSAAPVGSASPRSPPVPVPVTAGRDPAGARGWSGAGLSPLPPSSRGVKNSARVMNM